ncbi:hypothetical protein ANCCAN_09259 [Ancylostoma caninum]|uniref:Uncharacterized protein n=1 Tax=Ancylostoma caninum TaxID=29170 RepID=A0A368GK62_ANCCA|nr:hypothetical protein ANCCAN_09259 [Ancylostoma caninum]
MNDEQMDAFANDCMTKIGALLDEGLMLDVKARKVMGKELRNYETQAIVFEDKGLEVARASFITFTLFFILLEHSLKSCFLSMTVCFSSYLFYQSTLPRRS